MKKIITLLVLSIITFTSTYATIADSTNISQYNIIKSKVFYINGEGYIKENNKLKKVEGVKFYSIGGQPYAKIDGSIIKMDKNNLRKINGVSYILIDDKLMTLKKFLTFNPIKKVDQSIYIHKNKIDKPTNLTLLSQKKINTINNKTLKEIFSLLEQKNPETVKWLSKKSNQSKDNFEKLMNIYSKNGNIELAKKFKILVNIKNIDIKKINKIIQAIHNKKKIKFSNTSTCIGNEPEWSDYKKYSEIGEHSYYNEFGHAFYKSTCNIDGSFTNTKFFKCEEGYKVMDYLKKIDKDEPKIACEKIHEPQIIKNQDSEKENTQENNEIEQQINEIMNMFKGL